MIETKTTEPRATDPRAAEPVPETPRTEAAGDATPEATPRRELVRVEALTKQFLHEGREVPILKGIDLTIDAGEMLCVVGTLTLMVQEKGREVAILKAMGAEDRTMVTMFLMQGLFIGVVGAFSGLGLGYVVCFAAEHLGIPMNPEVYYIDRLPVHVDPVEFGLVGVAAVMVCVLATIYPAILGSRLRPVDALRDR